MAVAMTRRARRMTDPANKLPIQLRRINDRLEGKMPLRTHQIPQSGIWGARSLKIVVDYLLKQTVETRGEWLNKLTFVSVSNALQVVRAMHTAWLRERKRMRTLMRKPRGQDRLICNRPVAVDANGIVRV